MVLYMIQLAFTSLIGVPLSTLAPLFEVPTSTRRHIDSVLIKAALQIICGGVIVFVTGNLIDRN
jgi:hypothetical protein